MMLLTRRYSQINRREVKGFNRKPELLAEHIKLAGHAARVLDHAALDGEIVEVLGKERVEFDAVVVAFALVNRLRRTRRISRGDRALSHAERIVDDTDLVVAIQARLDFQAESGFGAVAVGQIVRVEVDRGLHLVGRIEIAVDRGDRIVNLIHGRLVIDELADRALTIVDLRRDLFDVLDRAFDFLQTLDCRF